VDQVFYFGYDEKAYTTAQIIDSLARQLYGAAYGQAFSPLPEAAKVARLTQKLRGERHLLVLDNLESITGTALPIQHTLDEAEQGRLHDPTQTVAGLAPDQFRAAVESTFRAHYDGVGGALAKLIQAKEPQERQLGQALTNLEYENLMTAVNQALAMQGDFYNAYEALFRFLDMQQAKQSAIELSQTVLTNQNNYSKDQLSRDIGKHFYLVYARLATSYLNTQQYDLAREAYEDGLEVVKNLQTVTKEIRGNYTAIIYHQLGIVAQTQRQWATAESHYNQALQLFIEFNDRYSQASTYHQLGRVVEELENWQEAFDFLFQDLIISLEFNDEHGAGITLRSLSRVWQAARSSPDFDKAAILKRLAASLNITPAEAQSLLEQMNHDAS